MNFENISFETEDNLAVVTLNRPQRRNALSLAVIQELIECLSAIASRHDLQVVILAAAGGVFSSGHDLSEMMGCDENEYQRLFAICTELMVKIQSIPQPVIAEVQGMATAAGCQLVATCDLVVAAEGACFATPGVKIGLFCSTPMVAVSRVVGRKRALEMLLTGDAIDARTAADWGLVNRVVPAAQLRAETVKLARQIATASQMVVAMGKRAFYAQIDLEQTKAYVYAQQVMSNTAGTHDAQEGISAFLEKRLPCWTGK
jgi:enoyl-CoA hydratase/carnithine racemase